MKRILTAILIALTFTNCEKEDLTIGSSTELPADYSGTPGQVQVDPTKTEASQPVVMPPAHNDSTNDNTATISSTTVTETFSTEVPDDAITGDPRLTFVSTDGKGGNEYVVNNRESDNAPAFIVNIDGDYRPVYGADGGRVQIQAGSNWFITYAREFTINDSRVLVEESITEAIEADFLAVVREAQRIVPAENNYSRTIAVVDTNVHEYNAGGTAGYDYYDVGSSSSWSLWVHIHEMGHNFHAASGRVDDSILDYLYSLPEMFFVSDYGNNNGAGELWADSFAYYYIERAHINHILEYIMDWLTE